MIEVRIYYESLEQAEHFTKPIIQRILQSYREIKITLVRKANFKGEEDALDKANVMRGIYSLVVPDILITIIKDEIETPLVIIEFTEAVSAEDHELQRIYGAVAALLAECFYIKVSSQKQSKSVFGKAELNPYIVPKAFSEKLNYKGYIIAEWETEENNPQNLKRLANFLACPIEIPILQEVIEKSIKAFLENESDWFKIACFELEKTENCKDYWEKVAAAETIDERINIWKKREKKNKSQLRYFVRDNWIGAKIYRFSHAMDPDRGILMFISTLFSNTHKIFGIYSLVRPKSGEELKKPLEKVEDLPRRFEIALKKDEYRISKWLSDEISKKILEAKKLDDEIDIHSVFEANKSDISSRVMQTLAYFLDGMYLNHNGVRLVWDKYKLIGYAPKDFLDGVRQKSKFTIKTKPLEIEQITSDITEDEVTYAIVHRVLLPNKFRVVSVSYPGAQGGMAVLPEPGKGKNQKRSYLDVIALPPKDISTFDILLNENKGEFSTAGVKSDVEKLRKYVTNPKYKNALKESLLEAKVIDEKGELKKILIGVGFGAITKKKTDWDTNGVDFIFRIESREKWSIGIFKPELLNLIKSIAGETDFPIVYKVKKEKSKPKKQVKNNNPTLFDKL